MIKSDIDFISKTKFNALYENYKNFLSTITPEKENQEIISIFNTLLENFRHIYKDSERKTNKIIQLTAEKTKFENEINIKLNIEKSAVVELEDQLQNLKNQMSHYYEDRKHMSEQIVNLKKLLNKYTADEAETAEIAIQVETDFKSLNKEDSNLLSQRHYANDIAKDSEIQFSTSLQSSLDKYENELPSLLTKFKVLEVEMMVNRKNMAALKEQCEEKTGLLDYYYTEFTSLKEQNRKLEEKLQRDKENYADKIKMLMNQFQEIIDCKKEIEQTLEKALEEKYKLSISLQEKRETIEKNQAKLLKQAEEKSFARKKAEFFEEHLAADQERLSESLSKIKELTDIVRKLKKEIFMYNSGKRILDEPSVLKVENYSSLMEVRQEEQLERKRTDQQNTVDHFKSQLTTRDKEITNLKKEIVENHQRLAESNKQLQRQIKKNTTKEKELTLSKKSIKNLVERIHNLKSMMKQVEKCKAELHKEIKAQKFNYHALLMERNKFRTMYVALVTIQSEKEFQTNILIKNREALMNALKIKDEQFEIYLKKQKKWILK